jgi:hypothetical protein
MQQLMILWIVVVALRRGELALRVWPESGDQSSSPRGLEHLVRDQ